MPTPGIYLINSTGETVALALEDGTGDHGLLKEALEEMVEQGDLPSDFASMSGEEQ